MLDIEYFFFMVNIFDSDGAPAKPELVKGDKELNSEYVFC